MKMKMLSLLGLLTIAGSILAVEYPADTSIVWCTADKFAGTRPTLDTRGHAFAAKIGTANYKCQEFNLNAKSTEDIAITYDAGDFATIKLNQKKFGQLGTLQFPMLKADFAEKSNKRGRKYMQGYRKFIPRFTEEDGFVTFQVDLSGESH